MHTVNRILLIEDQPDVATNLLDYFSMRGFIMDSASDGHSGLNLAITNDYDAIVLDVMLPRLDGLGVCTRLRREAGKETPIIMLTARDTLDDKLAGFESGADDYLVKPFEMAELEARLLALITRSRRGHRKTLVVGDLEYDVGTSTITRAGISIRINTTGRRILEELMRATPNIVSRARLETIIWGDDPPDSDSLRSHIYMLRREIDGRFESHMLRTVHGQGYRLTPTDGKTTKAALSLAHNQDNPST